MRGDDRFVEADLSNVNLERARSGHDEKARFAGFLGQKILVRRSA
jgi:hypothetical protein